MKIAAAYIRVSTEDQTEYSPDSQIRLIREYAGRNDMVVPDEYIFADEGISGKTAAKRPEFIRMIGMAKKKPKPFEAILLWKFSRFARNRQDSIVYKTMLRKQLGIDVVSITENLGNDKISILIEAMIEAMDEYYSINLAEEVVRGMTEKAGRGEPVSIPAFGYDMVDKKYVVNPDQARVVQMIFSDFISGLGFSAIAQKINAMGIKTNRGNRWQNRTVKYIINNPVYIGKICWKPKRIEKQENSDIVMVQGNHQPIVDIETWNRAQKQQEAVKRKYSPHARQVPPERGEYMVRGLVRCSACGRTLSRLGPSGMQCCGYSRGRCGVSHGIAVKKLNEMVTAGIQKAMEEAGAIRISKHEAPDRISPREIYRIGLRHQQASLTRVKEAYVVGVDTLEEYGENKKRILREIEKIENYMRERRKEEDIRKNDREKDMKIAELLRNPSIGESFKNKLLRSFVDHIIFDRSERSLEIVFYI